MKRQELYELVWQKPMTKLAKELGMSDVGLAKLCRRSQIPTPPRGYWAKLAAGKKTKRATLPKPEEDPVLVLRTKAQDVLDEEATELAERRASIDEVMGTLKKVDAKATPKHRLVRATQAYIDRMPGIIKRYERATWVERLNGKTEPPPFSDHGRWHINAPDGLAITASEQSFSSVLDACDELIKSLIAAGGKVFMEKKTDQSARQLYCEMDQERIFISISEGYTKSKDLSGKDQQSGLPDRSIGPKGWGPSGKFLWAVQGTEFSVHKRWSLKREDMERRIPEIVATCVYFLQTQASVRQDRLDREEQSRRESQDRADQRRLREAREELLTEALEISRLYEEEQRLVRFLDQLEEDVPSFVEKFQPKLLVWLRVVREELRDNPPHLARLSRTIAPPSLYSIEPGWWPSDAPWVGKLVDS